EDEDWTMEFVSHGAETLSGYGPEELTGSARISWNDVILPDDRARVFPALREIRMEDRGGWKVTSDEVLVIG
ncbi:MAG: PAS domain-containing protein, partial [Longimicrobiales bacterium]|nr:PAS domain-containing protein [Longimicrobiales bacterium]